MTLTEKLAELREMAERASAAKSRYSDSLALWRVAFHPAVALALLECVEELEDCYRNLNIPSRKPITSLARALGVDKENK